MGPTVQAVGLAADNTSGVLSRFVFDRRTPTDDDVLIEVLYCGVCHSDLHQIRGEWEQEVNYPMVPGHEIAGIVSQVGSKVTKFKVGDHVGVGCMVDSCRTCENCAKDLQQHCDTGMHGTYNCCVKAESGKMHLRNCERGELLFGGYSSHITVNEGYVLKVPDAIPLDVAGPLLCAGITTYSPLAHYGKIARGVFQRDQLEVGVVGFGGLGHMAVKIAKAMGHRVTVISRSEKKRQQALSMGADNYIASSNSTAMKANRRTLHLIIDTASANHDIAPFVAGLLKVDGLFCMVGMPPNPLSVKAGGLIGNRTAFGGSLIGGIKETQEMLDFCALHRVFPDIEHISAADINNKLFDLSRSSNTASRYVIRVKETLTPALHDPNWQTKHEPRINPSEWEVNSEATIMPPSANYHAATKRRNQMVQIAAMTVGVALVSTGVFLYKKGATARVGQ